MDAQTAQKIGAEISQKVKAVLAEYGASEASVNVVIRDTDLDELEEALGPHFQFSAQAIIRFKDLPS